ncbi:MAG: hypothetical protein AAFO07_22720 [Bacteroidota bacterium]
MMRQLTLFSLLLILGFGVQAQHEYDASKAYPFGRPNPKAPDAIKDYQPMIGNCECSYTTRNQDGEWSETKSMQWRFKYIMNGWAVQDETFTADSTYSGSIRQYSIEKEQWLVHYYTTLSLVEPLPTWKGNKEGDEIVLYKKQKAPNGMDGMYRITFYEMTNNGFKWKGEWIDDKATIVYPVFRIECQKMQ